MRAIVNHRIKPLSPEREEARFVFDYFASISVPTLFFKIGILIILFEHWFEPYYQDLALTPFSTRNYIGIHLWPSQIWFIFLGIAIASADFFKQNFKIPIRIFNNARPIIGILGVYTIWSVYGFLVGNNDAVYLFKEMVSTGISYPALVYLARHVDVQNLFDSFIIWSLIVPIVITVNKTIYAFAPFLPGAQNGLLLLSSFTYSYFLFKAIKNTLYFIPALISVMPVIIYLNKSMLATCIFMLASIIVISTVITEKKNKYSISIRTLKITTIAFVFIGVLFASIIYLNSILDGNIERAFRENFIKERINEKGEGYLGDMSGGRITIWGNAIKLWKDKPIFGNGLGTAVPIRDETITQIHNYYLQALMDTGLVGLFILIFCWYAWYRRVFRTIRSYKWNKVKTIYASMLSMVVAYFFFAFFSLPMIYMGAAHFFWVIVAFLTAMPNQESTVNISNEPLNV